MKGNEERAIAAVTEAEAAQRPARAHPARAWDRVGEDIVDRYLEEVPEADALAAEANVLMIRTFGVLSDVLNEYFATYQLTRSRYNVLRFLHHSASPSVKMSEISAGIRLSKTSITTLVNALVRLGLVTRTVKDEDRRSVYISLTPKGEQCIRDILPGYLDRVRQIWSPLTDDEKLTVITALAHLRSHLREGR